MSNKIHPVVLIIVIIVVIGGGAIGYFLSNNQKFSDLDTFPVDNYIDRPRNFLGHNYVLDAQVKSQLDWREKVGTFISVAPITSPDKILSLLLLHPANQNLEVGQRYRIHVNVQKGALLVVQGLEKY